MVWGLGLVANQKGIRSDSLIETEARYRSVLGGSVVGWNNEEKKWAEGREGSAR